MQFAHSKQFFPISVISINVLATENKFYRNIFKSWWDFLQFSNFNRPNVNLGSFIRCCIYSMKSCCLYGCRQPFDGLIGSQWFIFEVKNELKFVSQFTHWITGHDLCNDLNHIGRKCRGKHYSTIIARGTQQIEDLWGPFSAWRTSSVQINTNTRGKLSESMTMKMRFTFKEI